MSPALRRVAVPIVSIALALAVTLDRPSTASARSHTHHRQAAIARLSFEVVDGNGHRVPGKLTLLGVGRTPKPRLGPPTGLSFDGGVAALNRIFSITGQGAIDAPIGTYELIVSRGPEWDTYRTRVEVGLEGAAVRATIHRVVDTRGWISADMHVHAERSTDSRVPMRARVEQLIAEGTELVVITDHNTITDLRPIIAELGVGHLIAAACGEEITTRAWGHLGAFPLPPQATGLSRSEVLHARTGAALIGAVRSAAPESIVIVNHPHSHPSSYLRDGGWSPRTDHARPGFSWDFDAIEILNGYHRLGFGRAIERDLSYWFALIEHGHLVAGVGSSDSHGLRGVGGEGGYPRTYVLVGDDRPDARTADRVVRALRERRAIFTTGPFVTATVNGHPIGSVAPAPGGTAWIDIEVQAAPWVPVNRLTIYVDGKPALRESIPGTREAVRARLHRRLQVARDAFVVVRVDGKGTLEPVAGEKGLPLPIMGMTNPIFLDVDGNGVYDPPPQRSGHRHPGRKHRGSRAAPGGHRSTMRGRRANGYR